MLIRVIFQVRDKIQLRDTFKKRIKQRNRVRSDI